MRDEGGVSREESRGGARACRYAILKAARAWEADALLLGTNAFSSKTLGSVSDGCAQEARCTTIVVKDPRV